jgi:catechol 2,3-dioxygenase-like lactoylglutathione lyase family enzyme
MTTELGAVPSHLGLCVADLDRSLRFYCEGLGFEPAGSFELDDTALPGLERGLELASPVAMTSTFIELGTMKIELLSYRSPQPHGAPSVDRAQLGFTHLSFYVDDVDVAATRLVTFGGTLLESTRASVGVEIVFLADPDGARVELMAPKPV